MGDSSEKHTLGVSTLWASLGALHLNLWLSIPARVLLGLEARALLLGYCGDFGSHPPGSSVQFLRVVILWFRQNEGMAIQNDCCHFLTG